MCALGIDIYLNLWGYWYFKLEGKAHWRKCFSSQKWQEVALATQNPFFLNAYSRYSWIVSLSSSFHWHKDRRPWSHKLADCSRSWWGHDKQGSNGSVKSFTVTVLCCDLMQDDIKPFWLLQHMERLICFQRIEESHEYGGLHKNRILLIIPISDLE